jgi:hypothetical protein
MPELREECGRVKAAADPDPDATYRKLHAARRLRRWTGPDGAWNLVARGTPEHGVIFNAALNPILDRIFRVARRTGQREHPDAYAFDALIALAHGEDGVEPDSAKKDRAGDAAAAAPGASPAMQPRQAGVSPHYRALIRVDLEALLRGRVEGGEVCEISGVGPVPARRARELLGDAVLHLIITRGVDVLNVTHLGRGPTAAQRVALAWTAPVCTVEGCYRRRLENDHREPWAKTRHTRLDELDPLCGFHHDLKDASGRWCPAPVNAPSSHPAMHDTPTIRVRREATQTTESTPDHRQVVHSDRPALTAGRPHRQRPARRGRVQVRAEDPGKLHSH